MRAAWLDRRDEPRRVYEALGLAFVFLAAALAFGSASIALQLRSGEAPLGGLGSALTPPLVLALGFLGLHVLLRVRRIEIEEMILPGVALLMVIGLVMIWRLRGPVGAWQQLRSFLIGIAGVAALLVRPRWVELGRRWAVPIALAGLGLSLLTAGLGIQDQSGVRLALQLGPLSFQTTEFVKVALIVFLAWFAETEGQRVEGRTRFVFGWLPLPPLRYFLPGALFVGLATLSLALMADFGAVLILIFLFVGGLYAAFETRIFTLLMGVGLALALLAGAGLVFFWHVPDVIHYRFLAFLDPWSSAPMVFNGQSSGITVAEGPGYQLQEALYAIISGGLTGTGLGFGTPGFIPLAHSDFIFASIIEEMGGITGLAVLALYAVLLMRIFRVAVLLPSGQVFERMLVVGIGIHFLAQVLVMVGGTLDLLPMTGVTLPFLSQGGTALMVNLAEVGAVLALVQRIGVQPR